MTTPEHSDDKKPAPDGADKTRIALSLLPQDATQITPDDATRIEMPADATRLASAEASQEPPPPPARIVEPGVLINDNYRILKLVSAGGMGEVYRAENIFTGDPVAVKIILPNLARDESIIDLFRREARILVQMRDDAIVRYHNFVKDRRLDRYCLIMEFVEGCHLWDFIQKNGPLLPEQALVLMRRLARGLAQAHAQGVTHRDLSPDNVILRDDRIDEAVLIDFGIARSTELGDGLDGRFAGKFKYIAPEQMGHGRGEIGPPADVYGLALMIAAALRGKPLEMGSNIVEASEARRAIPDLSGISHRVYPFLQHMLEPDPDKRPPDMEALLRILDDPMHLPARYRLPLWRGLDQQAELSADEHDPTGEHGYELSAMTDFASNLASSSPFASHGPAPVEHSGTVTHAPRKGLPLIIGAVVVALVGAGIWMIMPAKPSLQPETPAEVVATAPDLPELPKRDTETRDGFLAAQPLPACSFATRIPTGVNAGKIGTISDRPQDYSALVAAYEEKFATGASIVSTEIQPAQCPTLDFARMLAGRQAAPPALSLDSSTTVSGERASGRIRDLRGRSLWLFVVSPKGGVYDLSSLAVAQADGSFAFEFGIALADHETAPQPQLVVSLASDTPLTSVAAAPAGSDAGALLPLVLQEIQRLGGTAALDMALMTVTPKPPEPAEVSTPPAE